MKALLLICQLNHWGMDTGSTEIKTWRAPVINDGVYYYAQINETYVEGDANYRISSRYSLANGFLYAEVFERNSEKGSYSDSYQMTEKPNISTRFQSLELKCHFNRSKDAH